MTTPNLGLPELAASQSQPHVTHNTAIRMIDALVQLSVISQTPTPPGSPLDGDRYIVDVGATGAWAGHDLEVAAYVGTSWIFFAPEIGWIAYDQSIGSRLIYGVGSPIGWEPEQVSLAPALADLTDVDVTGAADGDALTFDSGTSTWVPTAAGSSGAVTPDTPPATADSMDDEFDDGTFDTGKWSSPSAFNAGSVSSATENNGAYVMVLAPGSNEKAWVQAVSGSAWKFRAKLRFINTGQDQDSMFDTWGSGRFGLIAALSNKYVGPFILPSGTANAQIGQVGGTDNGIATVFTGYTTDGLHVGDHQAAGLYLEIELSGGNLLLRASPSGHEGTFRQIVSRSAASDLGGTPDQIGFKAVSASSSVTVAYLVEWFRKIS